MTQFQQANDASRVILVCGCILSVMFWLYCMKVLTRHPLRKEYFQKRGPILLEAYLWLSGVTIIIVIPLCYTPCRYGFLNSLCSETLLSGIYWYSTMTLVMLSGSESLSIFVLRILLQFMNIRRAQDSDDWKHQIDPNYTSFALKYYHILGNPKKLLLMNEVLMLIQMAVSIVIIILIGFKDGKYSDAEFYNVYTYILSINTGIWFMRLVILFYCGFEMRNFIDYWEIRNEMKIVGISIIVFLLATVGTVSLTPLVNGWIINTSFAYAYVIWSVFTWFTGVVWVKNRIHRKKLIAQTQKQKQLQQIGDLITVDEILHNPKSYVCFVVCDKPLFAHLDLT